MIQAIARVLQNVIEVRVGNVIWTARPVLSGTPTLAQRLAALFSTNYETRLPSEPEKVHSNVSYHAKKDEILIQIGEEKWRTRSSLFGPTIFEYGGIAYHVNEKLTGRFAILRGEAPVAEGEVGFRSCTLREYPPELETFLANLCLGYLIRTLAWAQ
jgi:hypothetical protein